MEIRAKVRKDGWIIVEGKKGWKRVGKKLRYDGDNMQSQIVALLSAVLDILLEFYDAEERSKLLLMLVGGDWYGEREATEIRTSR